MTKEVCKTPVGTGCRVGAELDIDPDGPSDDSNPRTKATVPVKPAPYLVRHTDPRMTDSQDHVNSQHTPMNDKVLDLPKNLGLVEETGYNAGPDKPSFDKVADIDHIGPDIDLVESKRTQKLMDGLAKDEPDRKAP